MTTPTTTSAAMGYLAAVEQQLADLPADERTALLEDLALHLDALGEEDDDRPLEVRLGTPAAYAAELRVAAGLPPRGAARPGLPDLRGVVARLWGSRPVREVRAFLPQLRPAWWVLRGYLVVLLPNVLEIDGGDDVPVPEVLGSNEVGALLVLLAVVASVAVGRRRLPRLGALLVVAVDVLVVVTGLLVLDKAPDRLERVVYASSGPGTAAPTLEQPLLSRFGPVTDVLPYAADGTPLDGVLLFDQDGRPLRVGMQQWWADGCRRVLEQPRAADGVAVDFSYPQRYVLENGEVAGAPCAVERGRPPVPLPTYPATPAP